MTSPVADTQQRSSEGGFTLIELLVSMAVILIVSGIVVGSTIDMTRLGQKMTNRSDMHSGVRNATALLQQEVGQAGRVSLPGSLTLAGATGIGTFSPNIQSIIDGVVGTSTEGLFVGEHVIVGTLNVKLGGKNMTFFQRVTARPLGQCPHSPGPSAH